MGGIPVTGEELGNRVKGSRAPPDVEEEVLNQLPRWRRELLKIMKKARRDAAAEKGKAGDGR